MEVSQDGEPSDKLLRPSKRRKFYRKRVEDDDDRLSQPSTSHTYIQSPGAAQMPSVEDHSDEASISTRDVENGGSLSIAELIRRRKLNQRKRTGVEFTSELEKTATPPVSSDLVLASKDETPEIVKAMESRFAQQTGRVIEETNLLMEAYIEREMKKRSQAKHIHPEAGQTPLSPNGTPVSPSVAMRARNPASQGKLHEIDLGPSARLLNEARTEAAISGAPINPPPPKKPPKPRIGRNGKVYIPRPRGERNRRNSADAARDKVVEDLLRENKLDVYEEIGSDQVNVSAPGQGGDDEGAADDRLAEQFQKEYFDAQNQRKEKAHKSTGATGAGGKAGEERAKGPKLGGSRNARAAMKEREEAAARAAAASKARR